MWQYTFSLLILGVKRKLQYFLSSPVIGAIALVISVALYVDASNPTDHTDNEPFHSPLGWVPKKDTCKCAFGSHLCTTGCSLPGSLI